MVQDAVLMCAAFCRAYITVVITADGKPVALLLLEQKPSVCWRKEEISQKSVWILFYTLLFWAAEIYTFDMNEDLLWKENQNGPVKWCQEATVEASLHPSRSRPKHKGICCRFVCQVVFSRLEKIYISNLHGNRVCVDTTCLERFRWGRNSNPVQATQSNVVICAHALCAQPSHPGACITSGCELKYQSKTQTREHTERSYKCRDI